MDVNRIKGYCIGIILFILFNITAFAIPTTRTTTFWITYVFTIIAFIAQIFIWNFADGRKLAGILPAVGCVPDDPETG